MKVGWCSERLGDLCNIELGKTPSRADKSYWDETRQSDNVWLSIADLLNVEDGFACDSKEYLTDKGALISKVVEKGTLLASFKLTLGRLAFAGRDLYTNEAIAALTIHEEKKLSKEFLFYSLHFFDWDKACEGDVKLKGKTLNKAKLKEVLIHFPSLPEQQRIVAILDETFDGIASAIANAKTNLNNARSLFEGQLQAIFKQGGDGWGEKTLSEVARQFGRGKSRHRPRGDNRLYGGVYPLVQTGDIANSEHYITSYSQTYNEVGLAQSKLWPSGTVCIAIVGANVGETAILGFDSCFPDSVIGLVVDDKLADNEYVQFLLSSSKALLKEKGKGTARDNINIGTFECQRFPFPDLAVQKQTVGRLNDLLAETKRLESIYQQKLTALDKLKRSILHRAFTGDVGQ